MKKVLCAHDTTLEIGREYERKLIYTLFAKEDRRRDASILRETGTII
jgi:hypothetical protein